MQGDFFILFFNLSLCFVNSSFLFKTSIEDGDFSIGINTTHLGKIKLIILMPVLDLIGTSPVRGVVLFLEY
jgi:hypothetical protein